MKIFFLSIYMGFFFFSCANNERIENEKNGDDELMANNDNPQINNTDGKLYLRTLMQGSSLGIDWIYLGDDGTIVYNPVDGVNEINLAAERANNANNMGKYKIAGNQLLINWDNGSKSNLGLEFSNDDISYIDGGIATRQRGVPAGFTLNGSYAGGAITKSLALTNTYIFKNDGSFILKRLGSATTKDGETSKAGDELPGHYTITGNTLTLSFEDGSKIKTVIGIMNMRGGLQYLVLNQSTYRLQH